MTSGEGRPGEPVRPRVEPHEEFLELCALSTSGSLNADEEKRLQHHLATCFACREAMKEFEAVVDEAVPALASDLAGELPEQDGSFAVEAAEAALRKRLSEDDRVKADSVRSAISPVGVPRNRTFFRSLDQVHFWLPLAACALLCVTLGIMAYRIGIHRGVDVARLGQGYKSEEGATPGKETLEMAIRERDAAKARLAERDESLSHLRSQIASQSAEIAKLKASQSDHLHAQQNSEEENKQLAEQRDHLSQELRAAQAALEALENKLVKVEQQHSGDLLRAAGLEAKVAELSRTVDDQVHTTDEQRELLSHDRDIRELMGARDRTMQPLIPPGTLVQIDVKQTRVKKRPSGESASQFPFDRPIYFLDVRDGYRCGWCEIKAGQLMLIPHPDSPEEIQTFRFPSEVEVVGRVTGVAMRIARENAAKDTETKK